MKIIGNTEHDIVDDTEDETENATEEDYTTADTRLLFVTHRSRPGWKANISILGSV